MNIEEIINMLSKGYTEYRSNNKNAFKGLHNIEAVIKCFQRATNNKEVIIKMLSKGHT